ncbi:GGDEF domain-containing protein [Rhizobium sp. FKY42]|uniref:GGDEF domain-containing protein n=1 Tax=Rhizobium sp. FKY42 TaxID=2562310 RepID=UPI001485056E|nr:GGDEF domain-containing protein [Rhizobium sp. FKY42]
MDAMTGMLLWAAEALTLAFLLIAAWLHNRSQTVMGLWGLGFACHGASVCLVGLRGVIPDFTSIVLGNELILLGIACWGVGVCVYDGVKARVWLLIPALLYPIVVCLPQIYPYFWIRSVVIQWASAAGYLILAFLLLTGQRPVPYVRRVFTLVACCQALIMINMGVQVLISKPVTFAQMPNLLASSVGNIICLVAGLMLGGRMLMVKSEERLERAAVTDPLTGVLNRRGFLQRFNMLRQRVASQRTQLALILFDLDNFKQINDLSGHMTGDRVLAEFCATAQSCIGLRGEFGRMGGEEFACVVPVGSRAEAAGLAEAIRLTFMRQEIATEQGTRLSATVSAGIAIAGGPIPVDLDEMLSRADKSLYFAKNAGRNRTALHDGLNISCVTNQRGEDARSGKPIQLTTTNSLAQPTAGAQ